jgi:hypothetical protein
MSLAKVNPASMIPGARYAWGLGRDTATGVFARYEVHPTGDGAGAPVAVFRDVSPWARDPGSTAATELYLGLSGLVRDGVTQGG